MVRLGSGYCIDSTEVTRRAYTTWLGTNPILETSGMCIPNNSYQPACTWAAGTDDYPATCIDWCDAKRYCELNGKSLCAGTLSLPPPFDEYDNPDHSVWYEACSSNEVNRWVYGAAFVEGQCVDTSLTPAGVRPVGSMPSCQAPSAANDCVFDLNGNAWEWENSCEQAGTRFTCHIRGGSFAQSGTEQACDHAMALDFLGMAVYADSVGFRCCSTSCSN